MRPKIPEHIRTGQQAEERAAVYLEPLGFRIVERNYLARRGEIDIVARDGDALVFVEVRSRRSELFGEAVETVGPTKRASLIRAARAYLVEREISDVPLRFDIITFSGEDLSRRRHIRNAIDVADPWW